MNYLEIANIVFDRVSVLQITDTESSNLGEIERLVLNFINQVIYEIHNVTDQWNWLEQEYSTTYISGTSEYTLPSTINPDTIQVIRIGNTSLTYIDRNVYDLNREFYNGGSAGISPYYTIYENKLTLISSIDSSLTGNIYITYSLRPSMLVASDDTPAIPEDYHWVLVSGAEFRIKQHLNTPDIALVKADYDEWLTKMLRNNKTYGQASYGFGLDSGFEQDWTQY